MTTTRLGREQLEEFKALLQGERFRKESPLFRKATTWLANFPGDMSEGEKDDLTSLIKRVFDVDDNELRTALAGIEPDTESEGGLDPAAIESELWVLIPKGGFLEDYADYTKHSEAPLAYHVFCSLLGVGCTVNRRVYLDMGYYKLFPNLGIILLGPSGKVKKTTAANVIVSMLQELDLIKIYSEKLTPEALVEAMHDMAQGLIYAPELSVFLGKQKYMEGIIPLITRFMDCPDVWSSETIMRKKTILQNIAISCLMCSTPDWFVRNTPADMFGGGFFARNIIVIQEVTPRIESRPRIGDKKQRDRLMIELARIHELEGEIDFDTHCEKYYDDWYRAEKKDWKDAENELLSSYYQRKPDHVIRIALCIHIAQCKNLTLCTRCFSEALAIMNWTEKFLPPMLRKMFKTQAGADHEFILNIISSAGGIIDHSDLIRKVQHRMNAPQLRSILASLKDYNLVEERRGKLQHVYIRKG